MSLDKNPLLNDDNKQSDQKEQELFFYESRIIYFLNAGGYVFWIKYSPIYLNTFPSLDTKQIGLIQTTTWSIGILSLPFWSFIQDTNKKPNRILSIQCMGFPLFYYILQFIIGNDATYTQIFTCNILALFIYQGTTKTIDGLVVDRLQDKNQFGKIKFVCSVSACILGPLYGILALYGFSYAIIFMTIVYLTLIIFLIKKQPFYYKRQQGDKKFFESLKILFKTKEIIHLYIWNLVFQAFMFQVNNFAFLYYVREFKVSQGFIGVCLFFQKVPEIFNFYYSDYTIKYIGLNGLRIIALFALCIRFFMYSQLTNENIYWAFACESLHGFSLANWEIQLAISIKKYAPKGLISSSQSYGSIFASFGSIIGGLCGSFLYDKYGGKQFFAGASFMLFIITIICAIYQRGQDQDGNQQQQCLEKQQTIELKQIK